MLSAMESLYNHSSSQVCFVSSIICVAALALISKRRTANKGSNMIRRVSFCTSSIAFGPMPKDVNAENSTIQVLTSFSKDKCPSVKNIVEIVEKTFEFHRMVCIPKGTYGEGDWEFQPSDNPIDPMRMIRVLEVVCDSLQDLADIVQQESRKSDLRSAYRNLPWWEFILLLNKGNGDSMLVLRIDHAVGDGYSIGKICANFITNQDGTPLENFFPESMQTNKATEHANLQQSTWKFLYKIVPAILKIFTLSMTAHDHMTAFAKNVVGKRLRKDSGDRHVVVFESVPVSFIKEIKRKAGTSLNDVLLAALSQAIHEYCQHHKCPILKEYGESTRGRALMTYAFSNRNESKDTVLHNGWVPLSIDLGVGITSTEGRLNHIKKQSSKLKNSLIPHCQLWFTNVICPYLPTSVFQKTAHDVFSRHNLSCSNVPGPAKRVLVKGKPVVNCVFNVDGHMQPVVSMLSYDGQMNILFTGDIKSIPDMHILKKMYMDALKSLGETMGVKVPHNVQRCLAENMN